MAKYKSGGKKKPNIRLILACVILGLFVAVLIGGFILFRSYYGLAHYVSDNHSAEISQDAVDGTRLSAEDEAALAALAPASAGTEALPENKDLYNILLIGVDRRDTSWNGNSDSMIVASINKKTRRIHLISLMRDLYADIESYGARKLNAACAIGGPTLLVSTIESNYRIKIDHYACVDFVSMARIIDLLGGVTIEVSEEEATTANGLIQDMCNTQGIDSAGHLYENGAGSYNADGLMAVGYSRIRFVGNSDYERTERQRFVLSQIMSRVKSMNAQELNAFIRGALPYITHNIDSLSMISLMAQLPSYRDFELVQSRVPYDGLYSTQNEILVPVQPDTNNRIQEELNS